MTDSSSNPKAPTPAGSRPVGRPRRLTLEAIVDVACELGLERIEMGEIARRLGTAVGTLYSYVRSREHLLQLVAERLARRYHVEDRGQDWRQLLRDHAQMADAVFAAMPHLIGDLITADEGQETFRYAQRFVGLLTARGIARTEAIALYVEVTQIVIGAAVNQQRKRAHLEAAHAAGETIAIPQIVGDYRPTLERLIRDADRQIAERACDAADG